MNISAFPGVVVVPVLFLAAWLVVKSLSSSGPLRLGPATYARKPLLTAWELAALGEMRRELPGYFHICPQVRLADLMNVQASDPSVRQTALNKVTSKSVDFVVVDTAGRALLVVELDDRSHDREDRRDRDRLVDAVLGQCGIPIRRVRPRQHVRALAALRELHPTLMAPS